MAPGTRRETRPDHPHDAEHMDNAAHSDHAEHAEHAAVFRTRFWVSLALTVPVVTTSPMVTDWLGYRLAEPWSQWVAPVLGTVVFAYGGWPFLTGAVAEARQRRPGMMLLIGMAVTVAFLASAAASLGWFNVELWWELCLLIVVMLLGHWLEMRAVGQARGALAALAELLPDTAERVTADEIGRAHV